MIYDPVKSAEVVNAKVDALPHLTDEQREHLREICHAHVRSHTGAEPAYEALAHAIRSGSIQRTPAGKFSNA